MIGNERHSVLSARNEINAYNIEIILLFRITFWSFPVSVSSAPTGSLLLLFFYLLFHFNHFCSRAHQFTGMRIPVRSLLGRLCLQHQLREMRTRRRVLSALRCRFGLRRQDQEVQLARRTCRGRMQPCRSAVRFLYDVLRDIFAF